MSRDSATIEDFRAWLDLHLDTTVKETLFALNKMRNEAMRAGIYDSGPSALREVEIMEQGLRRGIDLALGKFKHARRVTSLDHAALRRVTQERLNAFLSKVKAPLRPKAGGRRSNHPAIVKLHADALPKLDAHLEFALRQFDVGLLDPTEPDTPLTMNNSISIGVMSGGMLQQATDHSSQSASNSFNVGSAKEALDALTETLKGAMLPQDTLADIQADIETIRAQLAKATPSPSIVREAARSLRSIVEGIAAGVLTSPVAEAAEKLFRVLGFG
jgi:hypothetical protein